MIFNLIVDRGFFSSFPSLSGFGDEDELPCRTPFEVPTTPLGGTGGLCDRPLGAADGSGFRAGLAWIEAIMDERPGLGALLPTLILPGTPKPAFLRTLRSLGWRRVTIRDFWVEGDPAGLSETLGRLGNGVGEPSA